MYNPTLHFHFIGIGGSGMSGIAEILLTSGFKVSGSDIKRSDVCARLESLGATISIGHAASNVPPTASLVVYSSAVSSANPEMKAAKRRKLPIVRRAEVLAELMRLKYGVGVAGSHGKTTTTSMCGTILDAAGLDPTVVIGGQIKSMGTGGRLGRSEYLVAETDESDRSFLLLSPTIAVVTNIDDEHMSAYKSRRDLENSFKKFVESIPFYGLAVLCIDDPIVREIARRSKKRVITYGFSEDAQLRAINVEATRQGMRFEVVDAGESLGDFQLPMMGRHLVSNCLAAIAAAREFGVDVDVIRSSLAAFGGVKRRLEIIGTERSVLVMSDYGHHPTEITATLRAVRECFDGTMRRLVVAFQPHRNSRVKHSWDEFLGAFKDADTLIATDIYTAGEEPIEGISGKALCDAIVHPAKTYVPQLSLVAKEVSSIVREGDVVVCLGAGSIGSVPEQLLVELAASRKELVGSASVAAPVTTVSGEV